MLKSIYKSMNNVHAIIRKYKLNRIPKLYGGVHTLYSLLANLVYKKETDTLHSQPYLNIEIREKKLFINYISKAN